MIIDSDTVINLEVEIDRGKIVINTISLNKTVDFKIIEYIQTNISSLFGNYFDYFTCKVGLSLRDFSWKTKKDKSDWGNITYLKCYCDIVNISNYTFTQESTRKLKLFVE